MKCHQKDKGTNPEIEALGFLYQFTVEKFDEANHDNWHIKKYYSLVTDFGCLRLITEDNCAGGYWDLKLLTIPSNSDDKFVIPEMSICSGRVRRHMEFCNINYQEVNSLVVGAWLLESALRKLIS